MGKITIGIVLALFTAVTSVQAQPKGPTFHKDEVSLREGTLPPKGAFEPKPGAGEANNNKITLQCGTKTSYGMEITGNDPPSIGHYELVNNGTCGITATVQIRHITDLGGTTEKEEHKLQVPPGNHRSISFPIRKNPNDKQTFVVVTINCGPNTQPKETSCEFIQNLTLGRTVPPATPPVTSDPITLLPTPASPPGTTLGGSGGSKCETPPNAYVEVYTYYNVLGRPVVVSFTTESDCLCKSFIAQVLSGKVDQKPGQPVGKKSDKSSQAINVPAKNDNPAGGKPPEPGTRDGKATVKSGETLTIKVGCSGPNNNTTCKGQVRDLVITVQ